MELEYEIRELKEKYKNAFATLLLQEQKLDRIKEWYGRAQASVTHEEALEMIAILESK